MYISKRARITRISILIIWALFTILPIFWVFSTSFKPNREAARFPPTFLPHHPTLQNFKYVLGSHIMSRALLNSIFVGVSAAVLCVAISSLAGYAFSRYEFKGKTFLMSLMLGSFMIPPFANIIPLYLGFFKVFGTTNHLFELVIVDQLFVLPLNVFLFKNYFDTIPPDLEESAMIDGCSRMQAFRKVTLPLALPAIAAAMIFAFRFSWNEFVFAMTFISSPDKYVFPAAIYNLIGLHEVQYGYLAAAVVIMMIPPLLVLVFFQRYIISGLKLGAVK